MRGVQLTVQGGQTSGSYFGLQAPGEILEQAVFELCLDRRVTRAHNELGKSGLVGPAARAALAARAAGLRGGQGWHWPAELQ